MDEAPKDGNGTTGLPRELRFLKGLVTVLTAVMIGGVITIVVLLVIRLNAEPGRTVIDPGQFTMPDGVGVIGISVVQGRTVIVGDDAVIRIYDTQSRELLEESDLP